MNNKIRAVIIDDETLGREIIIKYLEKFKSIEIVSECSNGFDGVKAINELKPDLVFLDIQMPKLTGFEMLELIDDLPVIIFTTAFDQYALKAFEVNATDYLLKPFSEDRFADALKKAISKLENKNPIQKQIAELSKTNISGQEYIDRVVVKTGSKINIIPIEQVKYIEAQDDYTMLYCQNGKYLKQKTMKWFEDNLDGNDFIRIHRTYIVKTSEIKQIELAEKDTYKVILLDGASLPVSKSGYQNLKQFIS